MAATSTPHTLAAPPEVLRLAGHPVRWQLLNELALSDRPVRELNALVGQRQSLTSYHLGQLRNGGLVTARQSSADGRDTYYSLDLAAFRERLAGAGAALHPGLRLMPPAPRLPPRDAGQRTDRSIIRVLFLCTGNSARSQMAEAILTQLGGNRIHASSAGSHPKALHPEAVRVMRERGIDISGRRSQHVSAFVEQRFDRVISLCDRVREACPDFPGTPSIAHWSMADPAADDAGHLAFARTAHELESRIQFLLHTIENSGNTRKEN